MATTKKVADKAKEVAAKVAEVKNSETVKKAEESAKKVVAPAKKAAKKVADKTVEVAKKASDEAKKTVAKVTEKKETVKSAVVLQFAGKEINTEDIVKAAKKAYAEGNKAAVKNITVYVKPEDNAAYYVVNGDVTGKIDL